MHLKQPFIRSMMCILVLTLGSTLQGMAQQYPPHPNDPTATVVGSFWVTLTLSSENKGTDLLADGSKCQTELEFIVYRTSTGRIDYVLNPNSIRCTGNCVGVIDNIPTGQLFGMLSQLAVAQGISNGYTACGPNCSTPTITKVYQSLCVSRTGTGGGTRFQSCDVTATCEKEYAVCCPPGASGPSITLIGTTVVGNCGAGPNGIQCETTCQ